MNNNTNFEDLIVEDLNGEEQATISGGDGGSQQPGFPGVGGLDPYQLFLQKQYFDFLQKQFPDIFGGGDD